MKKVIGLLICVIFLISGILVFNQNHELIQKVSIVEYGEDMEKLTLFEYTNSNRTPKLSVNLDSKIVGTYVIEVKVDDLSINKNIIVKDTKSPIIELVQDVNEVYEIPLNSEFNLVGNIQKISDEVDGDLTTIDIVSGEEYEQIKMEVATYKEKINNYNFKTTDEINKVRKAERQRNMYSLVSSNINTNESGEYEIKILAIDYNFNSSEIFYKVRVLNEGETINPQKISAGVPNGPLGIGASTYTIDNRLPVVKVPETIEKIDSTDKKSTVDKNSINPSNPVAKSALARVGQSLHCDELVSCALVDAGILTGDNSRFPGGFLALSCYKSIGSSISRSQIQPGDIIYYNNAGGGRKHVAVYVGNNMAVHGGFSGKVVLDSINVGTGPTKYLRMPASFTWDDASKMVFGYTLSEIENGNVSNPGGTNENIEVYTQRTVTYNNECFFIEGVNIDTSTLESLIKQFLNSEINRDNFIAQVKNLGCTIDIK